MIHELKKKKNQKTNQTRLHAESSLYAHGEQSSKRTYQRVKIIWLSVFLLLIMGPLGNSIFWTRSPSLDETEKVHSCMSTATLSGKWSISFPYPGKKPHNSLLSICKDLTNVLNNFTRHSSRWEGLFLFLCQRLPSEVTYRV